MNRRDFLSKIGFGVVATIGTSELVSGCGSYGEISRLQDQIPPINISWFYDKSNRRHTTFEGTWTVKEFEKHSRSLLLVPSHHKRDSYQVEINTNADSAHFRITNVELDLTMMKV